MGQHKHNPTAIAAKNGEIKPKEPTIGAAQQRRQMQELIRDTMIAKFGMDLDSTIKEFTDGGYQIR